MESEAASPMHAVRCRLAVGRTMRRRFSSLQEPVIAEAAKRTSPKSPSAWSEIPALLDGGGSPHESLSWPFLAASPERAEATVVRKIQKAAAFFDRTSIANRERLDALESSNHLAYGNFASMARPVLASVLTPSETRALCAMFDPEQSGYVDGTDFVRYFCKCGIQARAEAIRYNVAHGEHARADVVVTKALAPTRRAGPLPNPDVEPKWHKLNRHHKLRHRHHKQRQRPVLRPRGLADATPDPAERPSSVGLKSALASARRFSPSLTRASL